MISRPHPHVLLSMLRHWRKTLWALCIYTMLAFSTYLFVDHVTHEIAIWLPAGAMLGGLLLTKNRQQWFAVLLGNGIASLVWGRIGLGLDGLHGLTFTATEVLCIALCSVLVRRGKPAALTTRATLRFVTAVVITALAGGVITVVLLSQLRPSLDALAALRNWSMPVLNGMLLLTPVYLVFRGFRVQRSGGLTMPRFVWGGLTFLVFLLVTIAVFGKYLPDFAAASIASTLGYLPMPFLLATAVLWNGRGSAVATLLGMLLIIALTTAGYGPFASHEAFLGESIVEVQAYAGIWALLLLATRTLSAAREAAHQQARDWQLRYERTLQATGLASVEIHVQSGQLLWSPNAQAVVGPVLPTLRRLQDWLTYLSVQDQHAARHLWSDVLSRTDGFVNHTWTVPLGTGSQQISVCLAAVRGVDEQVEVVSGLVRVGAPIAPATGQGG